jgi:hypothetical protein
MLRNMQLHRPLRGRFSMRTRSWGISPKRRVIATPMEKLKGVVTKAMQLGLFNIDLGNYQVPVKFRRKRIKRNSRLARLRRRGHQYALQMRTRKTDRQVAFRNRASPEEPGNAFTWDKAMQYVLHHDLLIKSLRALRQLCEIKSPKAAEIWRWMSRKGENEPFAFETCVAVAGMIDPDYAGADPDVIRNGIRLLIRKTYNVQMPHPDVLRQGIDAAESGDPDAIAWCQSDVDAALSFVECCEALGFDADETRAQIFFPAPNVHDVHVAA